jgi:hypothetical protein
MHDWILAVVVSDMRRRAREDGCAGRLKLAFPGSKIAAENIADESWKERREM